MGNDFDEVEASIINDLVEECHEVAMSKGWWNDPRTFGDQIALMHSELSEALEEFRNYKGFSTYYTGEKPEGIPSEFADVLIRIFDTCGYFGIDLASALREKIEYNKTRPHRHGGKVL